MTNAIKIEFGFGTGLDRNQKLLTSAEVNTALLLITATAARIWKAYTLQPVNGGWTNPAGSLIEEPGYILTVTTAYSQHYHRHVLIDLIKRALRQEAVAVTQTPVNFEII